MKKIIYALAALLALSAPALAQSTKAQLNTEVTNNYPDNTTGLITPEILRNVTNDQIASWQQAPRVNAQTGTTYTFAIGDYGYLVTFSNTSPVAATLPQATSTFATFNVMACNKNTGAVTITPSVSTINGAATKVLQNGQCAFIISDGANYQIADGISIQAVTCAASNWINAILATGVPQCAQPAFSDISGRSTLAQLPQGAANTVLGNWTGSTANVAANAMPSCSDSGGNHLNYVSGTGIICGTGLGSAITALTGDVTASGPGSVAATLATVNSNVGSFGSATQASVVTVNGKGLVTAASTATVTPAVGSITGLGTGIATALAVNTGTAGAPAILIASGASAMGTSAIASAACATVVTATATGTATTDAISANFNGDPTAVTGYIPSTAGMLTIFVYPTLNTVNFKVCNNTSSSITPGAVTINWRVTR